MMNTSITLAIVALAVFTHTCDAYSFSKYNAITRSKALSASPGEVSGDVASSGEGLKNTVNKVMSNIPTATAATALGVTLAQFSMGGVAEAGAKDKIIWSKVDLPVRETLFDVTFDKSKPDHGWLVGAKGTFLETFDGGENWLTRSFTNLDEDEEINYRFEVASLLDNEGWIIGKPAIMLHTRDGGKQFERIPLSPKLPGNSQHL